MRWSIRSQILVPLLAMQGLAIAATTAATAGLAARLGERRVEDRLEGVLDTLAQGNFPATDAVLGRMHGLSGAHFLALGPEGRPTAESRPGLARLARSSIEPLASATVDGEVYRVARADRSPMAGPLLVFYPESDLRRARLEAALPPLALGGAALLVLAGWTGWTADRIARRLRRVEQSIARTAAGEPGPVEVGGPDDEVRELARTVDRMADDLRRLHDRIRLAERERVLARIAAGLAHQLRNALTGARVSLQLHARRSPGCAAEPALGVALRQLDLTEEQIRGLLAAGGRGPEGQGEGGPGSCDLRRVAREVVSLVGPSAEHARVALGPPAGAGPVEVAAGPGEVRAALLNLVQNAVEAAGQGGAVEIVVEADGSAEILDTGPGPPADLADRLFEPFVSGKAEGVGLGLALARRVAETAGGRLSWDRRGGRTCFRLELPRRDGETA